MSQHSKMHPLPPPPNKGSENQTPPTRPTVAPLQETSATADQSNPFSTQGCSEIKKKRKHRGKKSKKGRRQSFVAPSDESSLPSVMPEIMEDQHVANRSSSGLKQSIYRLGQPGGNLSSTSLESEALLDHRYVIALIVPLRHRKESILIKTLQRAADDATST